MSKQIKIRNRFQWHFNLNNFSVYNSSAKKKNTKTTAAEEKRKSMLAWSDMQSVYFVCLCERTRAGMMSCHVKLFEPHFNRCYTKLPLFFTIFGVLSTIISEHRFVSDSIFFLFWFEWKMKWETKEEHQEVSFISIFLLVCSCVCCVCVWNELIEEYLRLGKNVNWAYK